MKIDAKTKVAQVVKALGGKDNVSSFSNCQTRLRVTVKNLSKVKKEDIDNINGAFGSVVAGKTIQIIFGPGKVVDVAKAMKNAIGKSGKVLSAAEVAAEVKSDYKAKNTSQFQIFIGKFSNIFAPLIIGFVGAGLLAGIGSLIGSSALGSTAAGKSWIALFGLLLSIWKFTFLVVVGWRTSETFGGSGVLGAVIAGMYIPAFAGVLHKVFIPDGSGLSFLGLHIANPASHILTQGFRPSLANGVWKLGYPNGSVFGVMISAYLVGKLESTFRKIIPDNLDMILNPLFVLITLIFLNFVLIIPFSGAVFLGIAFLFKTLYTNPFGTAILSALFLITVVFGVHQGFVPIYIALVADIGVNALFPVLALAGAAQVGTGIALYLKAKKGSIIRKQISGAIVPAFLGIGEPMIYGVTLPRFRPFVTASLGAGVAGFFMGAINSWGQEWLV